MRVSERGFSLLQLLAVLAIASFVMLIAMPPFRELQESLRRDAAARRLLTDLRGTRSRAVTTGWQTRFVGSGATGAYRMLGRSSSAVAWPDDDVATFSSDTQIATEWVGLEAIFSGVQLAPVNVAATDPFWISFDSRGVPFESSSGFNPLAVTGHDGEFRLLRVSSTGRATLE
jgi:Tfp pilus assembly protein FimT